MEDNKNIQGQPQVIIAYGMNNIGCDQRGATFQTVVGMNDNPSSSESAGQADTGKEQNDDSCLAESNVIFNPRILTTEDYYRKVRDVILRFIKQEGVASDVEQINPSAQNEWYYLLIAISEAEIVGRDVFTDVNFANQMISWFPWLFHFDTPEEMATFKRKFTKSISAERSLWKYGAKKEVTAIKDMWARQRTLGIDYAKLARLYPVANGLKKALEELKTEIQKAQSAR